MHSNAPSPSVNNDPLNNIPGYTAATIIAGSIVGVFVHADGDITITWVSDPNDEGFVMPASGLPALIEMLQRTHEQMSSSELEVL